MLGLCARNRRHAWVCRGYFSVRVCSLCCWQWFEPITRKTFESYMQLYQQCLCVCAAYKAGNISTNHICIIFWEFQWHVDHTQLFQQRFCVQLVQLIRLWPIHICLSTIYLWNVMNGGFRKKLRADWGQEMLAIIRCRVFCLPGCYPKT